MLSALMLRTLVLVAASVGQLAAGAALPASASTSKHDVTPLPDYVLTFAPLSYLYSGESWWPADIADFVTHVTPQVNFDAIPPSPVTLENVATLNSSVFLTSNDFVEDDGGHDWLTNAANIPDETGYTPAPATIVAVEKPGGILDAFYFYFYAFDHAAFLDIPFGNHVGDWEHSMVRFINGTPTDIYLSAHSGGAAYTYPALVAHNSSGRAQTFIAVGSHANYATSGAQLYPLPVIGPLADHTNFGPLWDVAKNYRGFWFDNSTQTFSVAGGVDIGGQELEGEGAGWLEFLGKWGDEQYPIGLEHDQYCVSDDECHFVSGPTGPIAKNLGRTAVCQDESGCTIKTSR
ncbi:hypothetical protein PUNSTDRAFT_92710 [Punctularia strigosozonata HHB-11173 SS5]|uniref:Vacuolar protein sorting-associated protein 62 n=1 Tax=Punctularia strigosozonata (strain HHB-11173) TaxID=741275 RepID=R7S4P5_PUNST|nr:uncharacterized protein PUNSTDRAFT_92710 [Punctularia strigosozonata HHB-11173 SS5]EIN04767.1 hypothetical protein PUNSTDRAFT_92710 [Punctularia strigosozonata HHB-11173 SS5]